MQSIINSEIAAPSPGKSRLRRTAGLLQVGQRGGFAQAELSIENKFIVVIEFVLIAFEIIVIDKKLKIDSFQKLFLQFAEFSL
jgi:hypothetical protein